MSLAEFMSKNKYDPDFIVEGLKLDLATEIKKLMERKGVTKKELAQRMNVKPSYVNKILAGENMSLKVLGKVLGALEVDASISININD